MKRQVASDATKERLDLERSQQLTDRLVETLGEMKGLAMKMGQQAAYRMPVVPDHMQDALGRLYQDAPGMDAGAAAAVIERELGSAPDKVYTEWEPEPLAAASIGQVHRARTRDGRAVAVKIQFPGAAAALAADAENLTFLVKVISRGKATGGAGSPSAMIDLLRERLVHETDYVREATNQAKLAAAFDGHPFLHVPKVVHELSTAHVLTTDLAEGARFDEMLTWDQEQRDLAGEALFRFHYRCIFRLRLHSADPHPGNYLFRRDGKISCLDFGAVWEVGEGYMSALERLVAVLESDDVVIEQAREGEPSGALGAEADAKIGAPKPDTDSPDTTAVPLPFWLVDQVPAGAVRPLSYPGQGAGAEGAVTRVRLSDEDRKHGATMSKEGYGISDSLSAVQAVLATTGAQRDWGAIAREYWPFAEKGPSTELGELEHEWSTQGS